MNEQEESKIKKPGRLARLVKSRWTKRAIAGAALIFALKSYYIVDQTKQAVVTRFGRPTQVVLNPIGYEEDKAAIEKAKKECEKEGIKVKKGAGPKLKWPWDSVKYFDRRLLWWDGAEEQIPTKDKKYIWVDTTARYHIINPLKFYRSVKTEQIATGRLDDIIDAATRNAITQKELIEIVRTSNREMGIEEEELRETVKAREIKYGREKTVQEIMEESKKGCEEYGIGIHNRGVLMKGLSYVESVKAEVEKRMISERTRIAERYRSEGEGEYQKIMGRKELELKTIQSGAYKIARETEGRAEAEAVKIYAEAYQTNPEFYEFLRTLEVYGKVIDKNTRLLLGTDNPFLRYLKGEEWTGEKVGEKVGEKASEKPTEAAKQ